VPPAHARISTATDATRCCIAYSVSRIAAAICRIRLKVSTAGVTSASKSKIEHAQTGHPVDRSGGSDADYRYHYCIKQLVELLTVIN